MSKLWYALKIDDGKGEGWTMWEAAGPSQAQVIAQQRLGKDFRVVEVKAIPTFYQEQNATDSEEIQALNAQRSAQLVATRMKPVQTPEGLFPSIRDAAKALNMAPHKLRALIKAQPELYYFTKKAE